MSTHPSVFNARFYCRPVDDSRLAGRTPLDVFCALAKPLNGIWFDTGTDTSGTAWSYLAIYPELSLEINNTKGFTTSASNPDKRKSLLRSLLQPSPVAV